MITNPFPATFHERGYLYAEREHRPWYLIERGQEIGITPDLEAGDEVVAVYVPY
jgi:hypothetical protein